MESQVFKVSPNYKRISLFVLSSIAAFCSIVYELLLAQCVSVALGNTVMRYSFTIGLYLFSLGLGALFVALYPSIRYLNVLLAVEIILSAIGTFLPLMVFGGDFFIRFFVPNPLVSINITWFYLHSIVLCIGVLSGFELPLFLKIISKNNSKNDIFTLIGLDYIFTFVGSITFPFLIYSYLGIVQASCAISFLNLCVACFLIKIYKPQLKGYFYFILLLFIINILIFVNSRDVTNYLRYMFISN